MVALAHTDSGAAPLRWLRAPALDLVRHHCTTTFAHSLVVGLASRDQHRAEKRLLEALSANHATRVGWSVGGFGFTLPMALLGVFLNHPHNVPVRGEGGDLHNDYPVPRLSGRPEDVRKTSGGRPADVRRTVSRPLVSSGRPLVSSACEPCSALRSTVRTLRVGPRDSRLVG